MYSIAFPEIFNGSTVNLYKDYTAIKSNLKNLLSSNRGGLFGDPHFGTAIKQILWDQAHEDIMKELVKDEIYEAVLSYMPQANVERDYIDVTVIDNFVSVSIKVKTDTGVVSDMLQIELLKSDEN